VEFRLLGPLEVTRTGIPVPLGGPRQRALLTALLLRANRLATVPYLTESVWETPPVAPESNLRTYVAALRRRLPEADTRLLTRPGGYLLRVLPGECDLTTFDQPVSDLADTADQDLLDRLDRALALWRGQPMEGLITGPQLAIEATRLVDRRIEIALRYARAAAELGRDGEAVSRLHGLVEQYPLHEELWAQLIGALHRCDRVAEALAAYEQVRAYLARELEVEPGPRLRQARQRMDAPRQDAASRQLPMDIPEFTNRETELGVLDALTGGRAPGPVVVSIEGMAGVGKTRFAVHVAHRLVRCGRCRDVQLWADLHGFDPRWRPPTRRRCWTASCVRSACPDRRSRRTSTPARRCSATGSPAKPPW
jgi:DNA-binding SARP family transcriptional activator